MFNFTKCQRNANFDNIIYIQQIKRMRSAIGDREKQPPYTARERVVGKTAFESNMTVLGELKPTF